MVLGAWFAFRPSDRLLGLMRPLTLAAVFAAISNTFLGFVNQAVYISNRPQPIAVPLLAGQMAENLAITFLSFGCLSVAWLLVAIGMRRM
jgi:hypothetical protein